MAVLGDTRCVLEDAPSLITLSGDDLGNLTLTNDGIPVTAHTRVHEKLVDVLQSHRLAVYVVFTVARTVITAGNRHLVVHTVKAVFGIAIVKGNRHLGISHGLTTVRAAKDNILHAVSADVFGRYLTQNPSHSVGNVGLTASVRPHDNRGSRLKGKLCFIGEGFEALKLQRFQIQPIALLSRVDTVLPSKIILS